MGNQILASNASMHWCCPSVLIMGRIQHARQNNCEKSGLAHPQTHCIHIEKSSQIHTHQENGKMQKERQSLCPKEFTIHFHGIISINSGTNQKKCNYIRQTRPDVDA
jgi:hypothetical protein